MKKFKHFIDCIKSSFILKNNEIIFVYRKNTKNIGDLNCCPALYFKEFLNCKSIDILSLQNIKVKNKTIIVGGGGLLQEFFRSKLEILDKLSKNNIIIYWGVGTDNKIGENLISLDFLEKAYLCGIRNKDTKYTFIPCPSCMSNLFDKYKETTSKYEAVVYLHEDYSKNYMSLKNKYEIRTNRSNLSFEDVINFLSQGNTIITNSYHGAYWGALLNKKIVILPWINDKNQQGVSDKFKQLPINYTLCENINDIENAISKAPTNWGMLDTFRAKNIEFKNKIIKSHKLF